MKVGIIMGSLSDWEVMSAACSTLEEFGIPYEKKVISAHRTPQFFCDYMATARERGVDIVIAGAGGAALRAFRKSAGYAAEQHDDSQQPCKFLHRSFAPFKSSVDRVPCTAKLPSDTGRFLPQASSCGSRSCGKPRG